MASKETEEHVGGGQTADREMEKEQTGGGQTAGDNEPKEMLNTFSKQNQGEKA